MRSSAYALGALFLSGCLSTPPSGPARRVLERTGSVFVLFVVVQEHPCPFHPAESAQVLGPLPGHGCKSRRIGSGFVIDRDGSALTNYHVVERGVLLEAAFRDGRRRPAELVGADPETDLALLRLAGPGSLPIPVPIGDPRGLRVGDAVYAVGSPMGLSGTMTAGIVSDLGRPLQGMPLVPFIQTDVGLHPGNSGGPLLDAGGNAVGVNMAILHSEGLGFAVPIDLAMQVAGSLRSLGRVSRGDLGIEYQRLEPDLALALGLSAREGLLLTDVSEGGSAAQAGLKPGEAIVGIGGRSMGRDLSYAAEVAALRPGTVAVLDVEGVSGRRRATLRVGERERGWVRPPPPRTSPIGMTLGDAPEGSGIVVLEVEPGGPAERAGLAQGDLVVEAARQPVRDRFDFRDALVRSTGRATPLLLRVKRGDRHFFVALLLPPAPAMAGAAKPGGAWPRPGPTP